MVNSTWELVFGFKLFKFNLNKLAQFFLLEYICKEFDLMSKKSYISFCFAVFFLTSSFTYSDESLLGKRIQKQVTKEIKSTFLIDAFALEETALKLDQRPCLLENSLFKVYSEDMLKGYAFLGTAPSKTDAFEYLILFDQEFNIMKAKVLVYREDYGGEIASRRWLSQFYAKQNDTKFIYGDNISAISGATISVQSMTNSVNYVFSELKEKSSQIR